MPTLSEYTNVYNTALIVIEQKGYQAWYDKQAEMFCAEKDGWDFMAESPVGLLGLISIFEFKKPEKYGEYWWRERGRDLYGELPRKPKPYRSVLERDED
ncbi:hypothetical protein [Corallococcus sicarius]|uniref:Uncharacterized protein n=1 Tax=Corallococcus sicarius TaxID=2316726 RepID=A0A3A8MD04_9BACT|nr:hypothetical protein [Corallococcus sicarius]RKH30116.1 hypothetical protein D7X12_39265 [Corallococcus sicarius]